MRFERAMSPRRTSRRGGAIIEFAIILLVFIPVVGGAVSYGLVSFEEQALVDAIRVGTRTAAIQAEGTDPALLTQRIRDTTFEFLRLSGADPARFALRVTPFDAALGEMGNKPAVRITLTRLSGSGVTLGVVFNSTSCFAGATVLTNSNLALAAVDPGSTDC